MTAVLACAAGCSGGSGNGGNTTSAKSTPPPALANTIDFPLFEQSRILVSKGFSQVVNGTGSQANGVLMSGNGTYQGNEVIAATPASMDQLRGWLQGVDAKPPQGYQRVQNIDYGTARANTVRYGLDFALFEHPRPGKNPTGLLVIVMDPARVTKSLGPALPLISRYRNLPDFARKPIDDQVKSQTGFSVTEVLQPNSPIGMALGALDDFSHSNDRAILLLSAQKQ